MSVIDLDSPHRKHYFPLLILTIKVRIFCTNVRKLVNTRLMHHMAPVSSVGVGITPSHGRRRPGSRAHLYADDLTYADGHRRHIASAADCRAMPAAPVGIGGLVPMACLRLWFGLGRRDTSIYADGGRWHRVGCRQLQLFW